MKNMSTMQRFMEKVDKRGSDECWPFTSSISKSGCGRFFYQGKCRDAYRMAYTLMVGPIPDGLHLHHTCENRICVNPKHLVPVTVQEHFARLSPGHIAYIHAHKTHCVAGHELTADNLVQKIKGRRCLTCARRRTRECQARRRAAERMAV